MILTGPVHTWKYRGHVRTFGEVTLSLKDALQLTQAVRYNATTGRGEQRDIIPTHLRGLRKSWDEGTYTPTPLSAGLRAKHRERLSVHGQRFDIEVDASDPLALTDGGHRLEVGSRLVAALREAIGSATGDEKARLEAELDEVLGLPFTITVYLDGHLQRDFVNLQAGRGVDRAHVFSMKVQQGGLGAPFKLAVQLAQLLHKNDSSPFKNCVRFDSRGSAALPVTSLCAQGASDLSTSLVGLARVGQSANWGAFQLADVVQAAFDALLDDVPELLCDGGLLAPPGEGGNKGSATLLVGLGTCLAYHLSRCGRTQATRDDLQALTQSARQTFAGASGLSGQAKRHLMSRFAKLFFTSAGTPGDVHAGLPEGLLRALSASAFGAPALPRPPRPSRTVKSVKPRRSNKAAARTAELSPEELLAQKVRESMAMDDIDGAYEASEQIYDMAHEGAEA